MLFRSMYARYAERQGWRVETLSESPGEHGGFREVICRVVGTGVFGKLKFESGTHRVQRVPATESQGRIHTSAVTVAILPELDLVVSARNLSRLGVRWVVVHEPLYPPDRLATTLEILRTALGPETTTTSDGRRLWQLPEPTP